MLLEDVKNHLDITWDDEAGDRKLSSLIESGKLYLCRTAGAELLFEGDDVDHGALILLKVYVMYARSNALDEFGKRYSDDLSALREKYQSKL